MSGLSFLAMLALMYAMVDRLGNVLFNLNQIYMAGLMLVPMVALELLLMRHMYTQRSVNTVIWIATAVVGVICWLGIRQQAGITDAQFLRSMIPHHAGAILMCEKASLEDPRIRELCVQIIRSQRREIDQMKAMLQSN